MAITFHANGDVTGSGAANFGASGNIVQYVVVPAQNVNNRRSHNAASWYGTSVVASSCNMIAGPVREKPEKKSFLSKVWAEHHHHLSLSLSVYLSISFFFLRLSNVLFATVHDIS